MLSTGGSRRAAFAQSFAPDIPIEEAIRIARSAVPNAVIKEVELEREDRRLVWEVNYPAPALCAGCGLYPNP
ncbi:PepSY domain-containing protein [Thermostichus sp. MS-CIW-25]